MTKTNETFSASVRKVEREFGETGVGQENRTEVEYQVGFEVDGAFVPVTTVSGSRVEQLVAKAQRQAEEERKNAPEPEPTPQPQPEPQPQPQPTPQPTPELTQPEPQPQ